VVGSNSSFTLVSDRLRPLPSKLRVLMLDVLVVAVLIEVVGESGRLLLSLLLWRPAPFCCCLGR